MHFMDDYKEGLLETEIVSFDTPHLQQPNYVNDKLLQFCYICCITSIILKLSAG